MGHITAMHSSAFCDFCFAKAEGHQQSNLKAMRTGNAVDLQDPTSVETVMRIVEEVLWRMGHDLVTSGGIQADQRRIVPKR
jgi:hypothetical protein